MSDISASAVLKRESWAERETAFLRARINMSLPTLYAHLPGNTVEGLAIAFYEDVDGALQAVDRFLGAFGN